MCAIVRAAGKKHGEISALSGNWNRNATPEFPVLITFPGFESSCLPPSSPKRSSLLGVLHREAKHSANCNYKTRDNSRAKIRNLAFINIRKTGKCITISAK